MEKPGILSFDCYGTLVDWKKGILDILVSFLDEFQLDIEEEDVFRLFLELDSECESGEYTSYKNILEMIMAGMRDRLSLNLAESDLSLLWHSLPGWPLFDDTRSSLLRLREKFKLAVISNVDNDLISLTLEKMDVPIDYIITAEDCKSYKPSEENFKHAASIFKKNALSQLHVAQSLYHDIIPARKLGISSVWINRYREDPGLAGGVREFGSLAELADHLL